MSTNMGDEDLSPAPQSISNITCFACGRVYLAGTPVCAECGTLFDTDNNSAQAEAGSALTNNHKLPLTGVLVAKDSSSVILEVHGQTIKLPNHPIVILGRKTTNLLRLENPIIGLDNFGAAEKGVSRQHAQILRYRNVLSIRDLDSSNGTYLNGYRLATNDTRILRSGDEIMLGNLALCIRF